MSINNTFQRRLNIVDFIAQQGQQTLEQIAKALGIHFSSVWRHQKAIELLQTHPISQFWSSPDGMRYLIVVFSAVIYCFGIKQGTGAESLSEFFCLIGLEGHVATSPSALRDFKKQLIGVINQYGEEHQAQIPENKPLIGGADETFFGLPILVLMELGSGYLFFEVEKESRSFESWSEEVDKHKLPPMRAMVSDGAKALLKLAIDRLHCVHLPDVFHLLRDLGQPWVSFLGRERKRLERIAKELTTGQDKKRNPKQQTTYEQRIQEQQQQYQALEQREQIYEQAMNAITTTIHPFVLESGEWQLWQDLEKRLQEPLEQLEVLAQQLNKGISEIETFRLHIPSLAEGLHLWWQGVLQDLIQRTQEPLLHDWAICSLLPSSTGSSKLKRLRLLDSRLSINRQPNKPRKLWMLMLFPLNFNPTITKRGCSGGNNSVLAFSAHHQRLKAEMGLFLDFTMPLVASLLNYSVPSLSSTILM